MVSLCKHLLGKCRGRSGGQHHTCGPLQKQIPEMKQFHPHEGTSPSSGSHGASTQLSPPLLYMHTRIEIISSIYKQRRGRTGSSAVAFQQGMAISELSMGNISPRSQKTGHPRRVPLPWCRGALGFSWSGAPLSPPQSRSLTAKSTEGFEKSFLLGSIIVCQSDLPSPSPAVNQ